MQFNIPPSEIGQRLTAKDVGQIIAFEKVQDELVREQNRTAELEAKAKSMRSEARG